MIYYVIAKAQLKLEVTIWSAVKILTNFYFNWSNTLRIGRVVFEKVKVSKKLSKFVYPKAITFLYKKWGVAAYTKKFRQSGFSIAPLS